MAFTDLATVKAALGIPTADTSKDARLAIWIAAANATVLGVFGLTATDETEYTDRITVDDDTTERLWLRRFPVLSVTSLLDGGETLTEGTDFFVDKDLGLLCKLGLASFFHVGRLDLVCVYRAGWAAVPADLASAATLIAIEWYNLAPKAGLESERIGQYGYTIAATQSSVAGAGAGAFGIPVAAEMILAQYRRPTVVWPN